MAARRVKVVKLSAILGSDIKIGRSKARQGRSHSADTTVAEVRYIKIPIRSGRNTTGLEE